MIDRQGQQLGNYRILRPIGHGGFADVCLGEHIYLQTQVAIKLLHIRLAEGDMEGFLNEARTIAHLVHPHIVRVLDFGIEGRTPFLVMDYASSGTLRQHHPKGTRLPLETVATYTKQVADALRYAHEKKLIHRDIKPENMLLGENQQVLLSDFGIALITQSTRYQNTQEVIGTAAYMAPEQLQGKPRRASDQYSLGIVVYEWLCGNRPFHGSFTEMYSQHLFVSPPSLCEKLPELPLAVEKVVLTALAKDPKERFATIQAFATALEQACQTAPPRPIALPSTSSSPSQPLSPADPIAAFPSRQLPGLPSAAPMSPSPTKAPSAPSLNTETSPATIQSPLSVDTDNLYRKGLMLLAQGDLEGAAQHWEQVLDGNRAYGNRRLLLHMKSLLQQLYSHWIAQARQARHSGAWEKEIVIWEKILPLKTAPGHYPLRYVKYKAQARLAHAREKQRYAWMYYQAAQSIAAKDRAAATRLLEELWQAMPSYRDPADLAKKAGFLIPIPLAGWRKAVWLGSLLFIGIFVCLFFIGIVLTNGTLIIIGLVGGLASPVIFRLIHSYYLGDHIPFTGWRRATWLGSLLLTALFVCLFFIGIILTNGTLIIIGLVGGLASLITFILNTTSPD